ncbi:adenosylcobinamide-GDP ribazoletransferase [Paenibacillus sp. CF384]|uniref:adenosylcobinamide-GDP ribazoletransferase n=1 Tax=Paenibacillus sp. CF384 TaxID=1884382 RepID=UPI00089C70BB|nr:adenosylcobinamide-GDP ribazoletransferase [Paenibacillus sp. CF384]SDW25177.1 cobalamin-5'-phosphate synthase [Paenibacillus sp. CF384]
MLIRFMKVQLQALGTALQLLTRIPVPVVIPFTPQMLARSVIYYPLVGAIIGGIVAGAAALLHGVVPAMPAAVIVLIVWIMLSGGLHMDGLMDTADGVLSHRSRERMLEIMKDSRVGAMGVLAAVLVLLFKFSSLAAIMDESELQWRIFFPLIMLACAWSRLWIVIAMALFPFARPNEGMAALFRAVRYRHAACALLVTLLLSAGALLIWPSAELQSAFVALLLLGGITIAAGWMLGLWLTRKLSGLTGDTYGAMCEIIESILLFYLMLVLV